MWSMWNAPSDRDYYDQFSPMEEEIEEEDPRDDPALNPDDGFDAEAENERKTA